MPFVETPKDTGLRTAVTQAERAQMDAFLAAERVRVAEARQIELVLIIVAALGLFLAAAWAVRRRAMITALADKVAVDSAAKGLRGYRKSKTALFRFADRVKDRASK